MSASTGLYCPAATSHSWLHEFRPGQKGERGERQYYGPLGGGMGVECGDSGLDTNSSLLTAGNPLEGQRALHF